MGKHNVHLSVSFVPLKAGQQALAVCGKEIARAEFPWLVDGDIRAVTIDKLGSCRKCLSLVLDVVDAIPGEKFVYGCSERKEEVQ